MGREAPADNWDIFTEYVLAGERHNGRAVYQQRSGSTVIYFHHAYSRWLITRHGITDSPICVAYADESGSIEHPGRPDLTWRVWDDAANQHVIDSRVAVLDVPPCVSLLGRAEASANAGVNGEYVLAGVHHGRPTYQSRGSGLRLKYDEKGRRWLLGSNVYGGSACQAFADSDAALHPGSLDLEWYFYDGVREKFMMDPQVKTVAAPQRVHVLCGSSPQSEASAEMCGTYRLTALHLNRPVYVLPGTRTVMRHSVRGDRWLIDETGLAEPGFFSRDAVSLASPSLLNRMKAWILQGSTDAADDSCGAFADAGGTPHPGFASLQWQLYDQQCGRFLLDTSLRVTTAPLEIQVQGRKSTRENASICAVYVVSGTHHGRAAYQQVNGSLVMHYCNRLAAWVINTQGASDSEQNIAYVAHDGEDPVRSGPWLVYEPARGRHVEDHQLSVVVPHDAQLELQACNSDPLPQCGEVQVSPRGLKRPFGTVIMGGA